MKRFSERRGLKKGRMDVQVDSMDVSLRNRLWNTLERFYWKGAQDVIRRGYVIKIGDLNPKLKEILEKLWDEHLKKPLDILPTHWSPVHEEMRDYFFKDASWYEVYDLIEFFAREYPDVVVNTDFMNCCNSVLENEVSAYRFVGNLITQITSEEEISEIEEALETPLKPVRTHIENSLKLLSDRKSPDYRNSIKESISAVEAICKMVAKNKKAKLGQALDMIESKIGLHGALKRGFDSLYGYTSDADGIRHALMDEPSLSFEDAKFMLVSCSAFINYLVSKASKAGIKL